MTRPVENCDQHVALDSQEKKACSRCGAEKMRSDFALNSTRKGGLQAWCRACKSEHGKQYKSRPEVVAHRKQYLSEHADERKRFFREYRKAHIDAIREYDIQRNKDKTRAAQRNARSTKYRVENPVKKLAHSILNNALRAGVITRKPCEVCGAQNADAHHADYSHALSVQWLCRVHHMEWHQNNSAHVPETISEVSP
jgi:hypothetical protein